MTHLVYIGNKLTNTGKTATTIDTLGCGLEQSGYKVTYASSYTNIVLRLIDMLWTVFKHRTTVDYVLIDTYSTLNFYYAYAVSAICRLLKLKYIPILHGGNLPERLKTSPKLSAAIFNNAYVNVSPSHYVKSSFERSGYTNIIVIPNSITIASYPFTPRRVAPIKMLWVRSFSKLYHPKLAVDVLHLLEKKGYKASLCMVGPDNDGSLEETKAYANTLGVSVTFTGKLSKPEWILLSEAYTVFINTTNFDNTPVSVIEAMALGLPIVSTNVGGMPFLIDHSTDGLLVPPNSPEAFVDAILKYKKDDTFCKAVIKNARTKAESFDWTTVKPLWKAALK